MISLRAASFFLIYLFKGFFFYRRMNDSFFMFFFYKCCPRIPRFMFNQNDDFNNYHIQCIIYLVVPIYLFVEISKTFRHE